MNIVMFGAGSTGRGHLAVLLHEAGFRGLTLIDKDPTVADCLKKAGKYTLQYVGRSHRLVEVDSFIALHTGDTAEIAEALARADVVITAVLAENLPDVALALREGLEKRCREGIRTPLNVIACENLDHASSLVKKHVYVYAGAELAGYLDDCVGFPDAMISRVVPLHKGDPLRLMAEDYNEWVVDRAGIKGTIPAIPCIEFADNLDARLEKKLWIHNGGHASVAYAGFLRGCTYIHEAVQNGEIAAFAMKVMDEIGDAIVHKHGFDVSATREYEADLGERGLIVEMQDLISRVIRDPLRKLGKLDRLLAPALYCAANGLPFGMIARSVANVVRYDDASDAQAVRMQGEIREKGLAWFLENTLGLGSAPAERAVRDAILAESGQ